jgi:hypothetical protein
MKTIEDIEIFFFDIVGHKGIHPLRHKLSTCWWNHDILTMICLGGPMLYIIASGPSLTYDQERNLALIVGLLSQDEL